MTALIARILYTVFGLSGVYIWCEMYYRQHNVIYIYILYSSLPFQCPIETLMINCIYIYVANICCQSKVISISMRCGENSAPAAAIISHHLRAHRARPPRCARARDGREVVSCMHRASIKHAARRRRVWVKQHIYIQVRICVWRKNIAQRKYG